MLKNCHVTVFGDRAFIVVIKDKCGHKGTLNLIRLVSYKILDFSCCEEKKFVI